MSRHQRLFGPTWVLQFTNAELIDAFETALNARETRDDAPDLIRRLDVLSDEMDRRYGAGMMTDDDWKEVPLGLMTEDKSGHGDIGTSYRMMSLSVPPLSEGQCPQMSPNVPVPKEWLNVE